MKLSISIFVALCIVSTITFISCSEEDSLIDQTTPNDVMNFDLSSLNIDLNNLHNYANQPIPNYINEDNTPNNNPITDAGTTLGRVLFYDRNLSSALTVSCASCHKQEIGFTDDLIFSEGVNGVTGRHSMRLVNARFGDEQSFFWDERANTLENQTTEPIRDHIEMGFSGQDGDPDINDLINRLEGLEYYPILFDLAFGTEQITEGRMQNALAQFIRSIQSFDSRYDEGRSQVNNNGANFPNFTAAENAGKDLFMQNPNFNNQGLRIGGGLGCNRCHQAPEFDIDDNSDSNGVIGVTPDGQGVDVSVTRSPSLRDFLDSSGNINGSVAMHNGQFNTIDGVKDHYNAIPDLPQNIQNQIDNRLLPNGNPQRLNITNEERGQIIAFMQTLTGEAIYNDEKWSDPFITN